MPVPVHNPVVSIVHVHSGRFIALHLSPNNEENLVRPSTQSCFINKGMEIEILLRDIMG